MRWGEVFTRQHCKDLLLESLRHCQLHKGLELHASVIMPNHVPHCLKSRSDKTRASLRRKSPDFPLIASSTSFLERSKSLRAFGVSREGILDLEKKPNHLTNREKALSILLSLYF
jgi:hypothetical protein